MGTIRLASADDALSLTLASRVEHLVETGPEPATVVGVLAGGGRDPQDPTWRLARKILDDVADAAVLPAALLPLRLPVGVELGAVIREGDARYLCVSRNAPRLSAVGAGSKVAVWDAAAAAQIRNRFPGVRVELVEALAPLCEGLRHGDWTAACIPPEVVLAGPFWGLRMEPVALADVLPAAGQASIAVLVSARAAARVPVAAVSDPAAEACLHAERTFVRRASVIAGTVTAAHATAISYEIDVTGAIAAEDGAWLVVDGARGPLTFGEILAREIADSCLDPARRPGLGGVPLRKAAAF